MRQIKLGALLALGLPAAITAWDKLLQVKERGIDPQLNKKQTRTAVQVEKVAAVKQEKKAEA